MQKIINQLILTCAEQGLAITQSDITNFCGTLPDDLTRSLFLRMNPHFVYAFIKGKGAPNLEPHTLGKKINVIQKSQQLPYEETKLLIKSYFPMTGSYQQTSPFYYLEDIAFYNSLSLSAEDKVRTFYSQKLQPTTKLLLWKPGMSLSQKIDFISKHMHLTTTSDFNKALRATRDAPTQARENADEALEAEQSATQSEEEPDFTPQQAPKRARRRSRRSTTTQEQYNDVPPLPPLPATPQQQYSNAQLWPSLPATPQYQYPSTPTTCYPCYSTPVESSMPATPQQYYGTPMQPSMTYTSLTPQELSGSNQKAFENICDALRNLRREVANLTDLPVSQKKEINKNMTFLQSIINSVPTSKYHPITSEVVDLTADIKEESE